MNQASRRAAIGAVAGLVAGIGLAATIHHALAGMALAVLFGRQSFCFQGVTDQN